MTYDELPYAYKDYAITRAWEENQALAYWQQAAEYREYVDTILIRNVDAASREETTHAYQALVALFFPLRGRKLRLS